MQKKGLMQKCLTGNVRLKDFGKATGNNALPDGWIKKPLKELVEMAFSSVNKKSRSDQKTVQLCNYMDVYNNDYITTDIDFMTATASDREIEKFTLQQGDVIITKDSETPDDIGVPTVVMENLDNVICGYHLALLRPKENEIDGIFLAKELARDRVSYQFSRVANGATRFGLTTDAVRNIQVNVPPLSEQKKIARILGTWDRAIDLTERLIEAKERRKKGLMQQMLTGKVRFGEFVQSDKMQQSKVGLIPEDWDMVKIKDIAEVNRKSLTEKTPPNYVFNYIDLSAVKKGMIDFSTGKIRFKDAPSRARRILNKGDVIMATVRPNLQGFAIADFDVSAYICSTGFALITPKKDMDTPFIYQSLYASFTERQIYGLLAGSNYPAINASDVENLWLVYPNNDQERAWIASTLSACDQEIELLGRKLDVLMEQKKGLMQQLLTGQVRVTI